MPNAVESPTPIAPRPFLKWAGGKRSVLPELLSRVPNQFDRYFEPFLGGGAMFFGLLPNKSVISDINSELINCYKVIRDDVESLISHLETHTTGKRYFYSVRALDRRTDFWVLPAFEKASRFIFLNRTCFNGLCRVNSEGYFNVPYGNYKNPKICDAENLRECSLALQGADIRNQPFEKILDEARQNDFVYFDPPYAPLSVTASFTSYAKEGFGSEEQVHLANVCKELDRKGVKFMLSNSAVSRMKELYSGFRVETIASRRLISARHTSRGEVEDILVRNY